MCHIHTMLKHEYSTQYSMCLEYEFVIFVLCSSMIQPNRLCVVSTWGEGWKDSNASHPVLAAREARAVKFQIKRQT